MNFFLLSNLPSLVNVVTELLFLHSDSKVKMNLSNAYLSDPFTRTWQPSFIKFDYILKLAITEPQIGSFLLKLKTKGGSIIFDYLIVYSLASDESQYLQIIAMQVFFKRDLTKLYFVWFFLQFFHHFDSFHNHKTGRFLKFKMLLNNVISFLMKRSWNVQSMEGQGDSWHASLISLTFKSFKNFCFIFILYFELCLIHKLIIWT